MNPPKNLPDWRSSRALPRLMSLAITARRIHRTWIGPGTSEALLEAYQLTKGVLDYSTYLYLSIRYAGKLEKMGKEVEKIIQIQEEFFGYVSSLLAVMRRRSLIDL